MEQRKRFLGILKDGVKAISPDCRDASRLQSEQLDHALTPLQRFGLRVHLILCKWCRRYGEQLRFLRRASQAQPETPHDASPSSLSPEARERLKQVLRTGSK